MQISRYEKKVTVMILLFSSATVIMSNFYHRGDDMSVMKWRPFGDLEELFEFRPMIKSHQSDMYEENGNVVIKMHVPGFDADDITVKVEDNYLHISGEQKHKKEVQEKDYYHKEIKEGSFSQVVSLPCAVDEDAVTAELHNGVLTITMPKTEEVEKETKKIRVVRK